MIGGWWGVAGDEGGCWAWWGRGADWGRGWRGLAMAAVQAMQSVHALLSVRVKLAGMAVAATHWWAGTGLGRMPDGAGGSTVGAYYRRSQVPGCARSGATGRLPSLGRPSPA